MVGTLRQLHYHKNGLCVCIIEEPKISRRSQVWISETATFRILRNLWAIQNLIIDTWISFL